MTKAQVKAAEDLNRYLEPFTDRIRKLEFEIRKRDIVIHNLRESKENLRRSCVSLIRIMDASAEENIDHDIVKGNPDRLPGRN